TYGTTSTVIHPIPAAAFVGVSSSDTDALFITGGRWRTCSTASSCRVMAPLVLPAGAVVTSLALDACIRGAITVDFLRSARTEPDTEHALLSYSTDEIDVVPPACTFFPKSLASPAVIDNANNYYVLDVTFPGDPNESVFGGIRVFYHLQVSPAPG